MVDRRIYMAQIVSYTAITLSITYTPSLAASTGASKFEISLIFSLYNLAYFISSMIFGRLADLHGRRKFILMGFVTASIAFSFQYFYRDYYSLLLLRIIAGFSAGIFPAAIISLAHDVNMKMGKLSSFGALGWAIGGYLAGAISLFFGLKITYIFSAIVFLMGFFIAIPLRDTEIRVEKIPLFPMNLIRRNWSIYLSYIFRHSAATMIWAYWPLFIASIGGNSFWQAATMGLNSTFQFFWMYFYTDVRGDVSLILWGLVLSCITFLSYALVFTVWLIIPVQALLATSWSFLYVGSLKYLTDRNSEKATATGLLNSSIGISAFLGPLLGGTFMILLPNFRYLMLFSSFIAFGGVLIFIYSHKTEIFRKLRAPIAQT